MDFGLYYILFGITIAIILEFIALIYHVKLYKTERFISWWILGMGLLLLGVISSFARLIPSLDRYALAILNTLIILGQGCYAISIQFFLNKDLKFNKVRAVIISGFVLVTYFAIFSGHTIIRMLSTSLVLFLFSMISAISIYKSKTKYINKSLIFLIETFVINSLFWVFRFIVVSFVLSRHPEYYNRVLVLSYISVLMLNTFGTIGLISLINERLVVLKDKERLKFLTIFETGPDAVLITTFNEGKIILANKVFHDTVGYNSEEIINKTTLEINLWENQSERERFVEEIKLNKKLVNYENYFRKKDKSLYLCSMSVNTMDIDDEKFIIAVVRDITEIKKTERKLKESQKKYKAIAKTSASWEAWFDENGTLLWTSDLVEQIVGLTIEECFEKKDLIKSLIVTDDYDDLDNRFENALKSKSHGSQETQMIHKNKEIIWVLINWRPVFEEQEFKGYRTSIINITSRKEAEFATIELAHQLKQEKERAERNSLTDALTGLSNRRYLDEQIMVEFFRMKRSGENLSVIILDVDFFKLYNDTYGHLQGDECLKTVAKTLKNTVNRATDIVARYGGEEFVVLLPDTGINGAKKVSEAIRNNIENLRMEHKESKVSDVVTVSLGAATFGRHSHVSTDDIVNIADTALYQAKNSGRNKVVQHIDLETDIVDGNFLKIIWSSNFESGNEQIDNQHKKLFEDANDIFNKILSFKSKEQQYNSIEMILEDLKYHFEYEEEVLKQIGYSETKYHTASHNSLIKDTEGYLQRFLDDKVSILDVLNFLIFEVIADHLYRQDKLYFPFIQKNK